MQFPTKHALPAALLCAAAALVPTQSQAEDIDIFTGGGAGSFANPKILIILDNRSNWSTTAQGWEPKPTVQGQAEALAISNLLGSVGSEVNLGLMEFVTGGNANDSGGFVRQAVVPMTDTNKDSFRTRLETIYNNIEDPEEKTSSTKPYGDLMYDAYNYFNGLASTFPDAVLASKADANGYTANYTTFKSPLSDANACGRNFVIFIGNPNPGSGSTPGTDSTDNNTALTALGGRVSPQLLVPDFSMETTTTAEPLGYDSNCVASQAAATTDGFATQCAADGRYLGNCSTTSETTNLRTSCPAGTQRYSVTGYKVAGGTTSSDGGINAANPTKGVSACHPDPASAAGDKGGLSDPVDSTTTVGTTTTQISYSNVQYVAGASPSTASGVIQDCPDTVRVKPVVAPATNPVRTFQSYTSDSTGCYSSINQWPSTDHGSLPATRPDSIVGDTTTVYTITGYGGAIAATNTCSSGKRVTVTQNVTAVSTTRERIPTYKYDITQTYTKTTKTSEGAVTTAYPLGDTTQCYASGSQAYDGTTSPPGEFASTCNTYDSCSAGTASASAGLCASGTARYQVVGTFTRTVATPTGTFTTPAAANADEWAKLLHQPKSCDRAVSADCSTLIKQPITTYTIDVYNAKQNPQYTELYLSMARVGGGKYFAAKSQEEILAALKKILVEIQSVNTTFASASLPVNATNRTQNANQVFIGMFRPDPDTHPRWYGNLKQYAIGKIASDLDLVDANKKPATNVLTGFIDDCAASFWTTNATSYKAINGGADYWANIPVNPDAASKCADTNLTTLSGAIYSDLPDGPTVEKGAVAEILRRGNDPTAADTWAWSASTRHVLTGTNSTLDAFTKSTLGTSVDNIDVAAFTLGIDVKNDSGLYIGPADTGNNRTRPSIHGDVVHSRPLPVNYGGTTGVTVYYGSNDGLLHAVDAGVSNADGTADPAAGRERWAYVAPEHYAKLKRLKDNAPDVDYNTPLTEGNDPKDYFFDGSIGIYQGASGSPQPVWIYPTQRRGGRMVYAFDVSTPDTPTLKWRRGCPVNLKKGTSADDTGCTTGFSQMGQTWSTPNVAFINGYSTTTTKPVVVLGGGYDPCEDADTKITTECDSTKGNVVYFIDAETGSLITSFRTTRGVAADVTMIDIDNDGLVDYAYAADIGGNIYRIDFVESPTTTKSLPPPAAGTDNTGSTADGTKWFMHKVAHTNTQGHKFLFGPALFPSGTFNYLAIVSGDREHPLQKNYPYTQLTSRNGPNYANKAYVFKDNLNSSYDTSSVNLDTDSNMLDVTVQDATHSSCTSPSLLSDTSLKGWYMYLDEHGPGEQGVTSAVIAGGMVTFSTNRPLGDENLSCDTRLGEARGYFVNLFNGSGSIGNANNETCGGSRSVTFAGGGLPPSPVIGIVPIDGVPTAVLIGAPPRDGGTASPIRPTKITPPISNTRTRTYKYIKGDN